MSDTTRPDYRRTKTAALQALAAVEWGYGFQGRGRSGQTGTQVLRITAYKTF